MSPATHGSALGERSLRPSLRSGARAPASSLFLAACAAFVLAHAPADAPAEVPVGARSSRVFAPAANRAAPGAWPQVHLGAVDASPGLERAAVLRVLRRNMARLNECYEQRGLAADPNLHGRATLLLTIEANGAVSRVAVETPEVLLPVAQCIQDAVPRFGSFPRPARLAVVTVSVPLHFGTAAAASNARVAARP